MGGKSANGAIRWVLIPLGTLMFVSGMADVLSLRAKYVSSSPEIGASLDRQPDTVTVRFSAELDSDSELSVDATGSEGPTGKISSKASVDPDDSQRRSLTVSLRPIARNVGTYSVDWHTKAKGGFEAAGHFYFAVGMPTPSYLTFSEFDVNENYNDSSPREVAVAGLVMAVIGLLAPILPSTT